MFAVTGWSVSAASIKPEGAGPTTTSEPGKTRKRKRPNSNNKLNVTNDNVADLWEKIIEQKGSDPHAGKKNPKSQPSDGKSEKPKRERKKAKREAAVADSSTPSDNKKQGDDKSPDVGQERAREASAEQSKSKPKPKSESTAQPSPATTATPPTAPKLTPLQASMREKLISARFRHLNETLYTRPSADALKLFKDSPEMFAEYHEGFRRQVGVWPENPVESYIAEIQARGRVKPSSNRRSYGPPAAHSGPVPLPRTDSTCTIADLGCGDAALAAALQPLRRKLRLDIRSFDLQSPSTLVTRADIAALPLTDGAVDVAIFCLALMGTNWLDFVEEAYRVLRWKGELWVAEIKSRFAAGAKGKRPGGGAMVEHSVGNRKKNATATAAGKKAKSAAVEAAGVAADAQLAVEVDGAEDRRQDTDVSAFVEALAKRGFVLRGEPSEAVDLDNKMFVKMYFVKAATPTKGKGAVAVRPGRDGGFARPAKKKFIPADGEEAAANESAILKPCVYKLR
ncbi:25S rRNA (adenine-N(1))-methyltransferase [Phialemonium atrogriseum]|uniref:Ribosomal RNA-processing protein 8 n=1 Tax=Phialemonium atrogriseum TaxID=1093897 RepID=A0AAJ0BYN5_9PEZI|nr:25S rRNA (adenine-N(1))-methyltransferase [Phialemonium atrogriseum]KAK1766735.1 25S rRNA (adenine-N(1))-methyltransferase [Phialemonium atrogriseum]